uniref:C-type lectin domain-containing protein n=1 Tax=Trichuris muris TaxID=70415 RepID=A0A5S6QFL3_TRIMR
MVVVITLIFTALVYFTSTEQQLFMCKDPGWFLYGNHCYRLYYNRRNYENAESFCKNKGSVLFLPGSVENLQNVTDHMPFASNAWIGLHHENLVGPNSTLTMSLKTLPFRTKGANPRWKFGTKCAAVFRRGEKTRSVQWTTCQNPRPFICQKDTVALKQMVIDNSPNNDTIFE